MSTAKASFRRQLMRAIPFVLAFGIWFWPIPAGLTRESWHLFAIFASAIISVILNSFPLLTSSLLAVSAAVLTRTVDPAKAFAGFVNQSVLLVVVAFLVANAVVKSGLGRRISLLVVSAFGRSTLGLGYSIFVTDAMIAPAFQPKGLGVRKTQMSAAVLIPGLKVSIDGTSQDATHVLAKTITFDKDDLQTAEMIQAGLNPTEQKVATNQQNISENKQNIDANQQNIEANKQGIDANQQNIAANKTTIDANAAETSKRFSDLSEYDTKDQLDVRFASGSTKISAGDQAALNKLAHNAVNLNGYIIQVKGFADSSGDAAMNQKLSMDRAQGVIAYLIQSCNVPVRHIVAPGAMGEVAPVASNETKSGRSENRRVEVKVLLNKGLSGT